ncbi:MAG: hypothetical protein KAT43_05505 [Nanoarchaeota archaeon]|nr:hypothetical protein [Nanoarchaeota archaeon]
MRNIRQGTIRRTKFHPGNGTITGLIRIDGGANIEFLPVPAGIYRTHDRVQFALDRGKNLGRNKRAVIIRKIKK